MKLLVSLLGIIVTCEASLFSFEKHAVPKISNLLKTKNSDETGEILKSVMESFKDVMKSGDIEYGIPILDPLIIQEKIDIHNPSIQLTGVFNAEIYNLSNYVINQFNADMDLHLLANVSLKNVHMRGSYEINGKAVNVIPIMGKGEHYLNFTELNLVLKPNLEAKSGYLKMKNTGLSIHQKDFQLFIEGLLEKQDISNILAYTLGDLATSILNHNIQLAKLLNNKVVSSFNGEDGKGMNIYDIIESVKYLASEL